MATLLVAILSFFGFILAYHTYGRYLARKIFQLDPNRVTPANEINDGIDFVPTHRSVVFGHHFTSIAGTGPIVGPAIAVFWGWVPALIWVLIGSIFIGAVHDFGALVVSLRSRGQTIGDVAGRLISPRARVLFLLILFFALMIVLAIFGLVVASIFALYPQSVLSVWVAMPMAVAVGFWIYKGQNRSLLWPSLIALAVLYLAVYIGAYFLPITLGGLPLFAGADAGFVEGLQSSVVIWTLLLLVYCYIASVLPVWMLLQPRDYINSHQLMVALVLLFLGLVAVHPDFVSPAYNSAGVANAPPIMPFLFITIACGAVSGFHCLVSSGTTSKQLERETDAQFVGFGGMLTEGMLAVLVILACCAGLGLGIYETQDGNLVAITDEAGTALTGAAAWQHYYGADWAAMKLGKQVGAFVEGGANVMAGIGIPLKMGVAIIAVMVACFAATTLDTATRLQRYVIQELGTTLSIPGLPNKYIATGVAIATGGALALMPGPSGPGSGGLIIWPLFGATNQLLAGLAFLVVAFYLIRHDRPVWFIVLPLLLMVILPAWAMAVQIHGWYEEKAWLLFSVGIAVEVLQVWMVIEGALMWNRAKGVLPAPLPPLRTATAKNR